MAIVVVGGHTRNIGKTSVVAGLIAALPELRWTAFKITQYGHGLCSANGKPCECETAAHTLAISEEHRADKGKDSTRFLAAGAVRSFWVRTLQGRLAEAMPRLHKELAAAENAIIESNSILRFLKPDLYLTVLDASVKDFKQSAQHFLDRADAVLWTTRGASNLGQPDTPAWPSALLQIIAHKPQFQIAPPGYMSRPLIEFVAQRLSTHTSPAAHSIKN